MPPTAATMPRDGNHHAGQVLVRERLMRSESERRLANLLQFVSSNLERAARRSSEQQVRTAIRKVA